MAYLSKLLAAAVMVTAHTVTAASPPNCPAIETKPFAASFQPTIHPEMGNITVDSEPSSFVYLDDDIAFVALDHHIGVLDTSELEPVLKFQIPLPPPDRPANGTAADFTSAGLVMSKDKKTLYASNGSGVTVVDVEKALKGRDDSFMGILTGSAASSSTATVSEDGEYVFITQEYNEGYHKNTSSPYTGSVDVVQVKEKSGEFSGKLIGSVQLGSAVVGITQSKDGSRLYVTSQGSAEVDAIIANPPPNATGTGWIPAMRGTITVLDVDVLKEKPEEAIISNVDAGCGPVRIALSPDGKQVWATARAVNWVYGFDAKKLESDPYNAYLGGAEVGTSPIGLDITKDGKYVITVDSNRFDVGNATSGLSVVDIDAAINGTKKRFPRIPTGDWSREVTISPNGKRMLISQQGNKAVQSVEIEDLEDLSEDAGNLGGSGGSGSGGNGPATSMAAKTGTTMFALIVSVNFGYLLA